MWEAGGTGWGRPGCREAGGRGLGSPPAGTAAARRTPSHGWARAAPAGTGRCRELPRRAGPAETWQGHRGIPRPPTTTRSERHQPPWHPQHMPDAGTRRPHTQGGERVETQPWQGAGGCLGGCWPLPSAPLYPRNTPILTSSGDKWWDEGSIWGARQKDKVSQGPGLGFGCPYGSPQGRPGPRAQGPQHPASGPTVPHTCSRGRPPGGPAPGPPSLSPGLPWLGSIGSQLPPRQRELSTASGPSLPSFPRGNRAAYRWLRCTPAAEVRPSSEVGDWGSCPAGLGLLSGSPEAQPTAATLLA